MAYKLNNNVSRSICFIKNINDGCIEGNDPMALCCKICRLAHSIIFHIMVPTSIMHWPSDFNNLLFEQEARYCRGGCNIGGSLNDVIHSCGKYSQICSADRFVWIPRKYFEIFFLISNEKFDGESGYIGWGHTFLKNFDKSEYKFLFPDCENFASQLSCNHLALYRPPDYAN